MWRSWTTKLASPGRTPTPAKICNSASTPSPQKKSSNGIRRASSFITCRTTNARKRRATPSRSPKRKPPSRKPPPTSAPEISPPSPASSAAAAPTNQSAPPTKNPSAADRREPLTSRSSRGAVSELKCGEKEKSKPAPVKTTRVRYSPDVPHFGFHVHHTEYSNDKEHPKQQLQPDWYLSSER